jgi:hypothetical protein
MLAGRCVQLETPAKPRRRLPIRCDKPPQPAMLRDHARGRMMSCGMRRKHILELSAPAIQFNHFELSSSV